MNRFAAFAALVGIVILVAVIAYSGWEDVADAAISAGWATAVVVLLRAVALLGAGFAWQVLFPPERRPTFGVATLIRFIREGINQLLPVGQVGGDVVGARLATFWRIEGALAAAVTIADVAVQVATQIVFALTGVVILLVLEGDIPLVRYALGGLLVGTLAVGGFFLVQGRFGLVIASHVIERLTGKKTDPASLVERLWDRLRAVYASPRRIAASITIHLGGWVFGSLEVYVALHFMGYPISFAEALVIESLGQAVRGAAFAVPGGLGIQEGGYIALGALFGVPPGVCVAVSLLKRVADLVLGVPSIVAWQVLEGRRAIETTPAVPVVVDGVPAIARGRA